MTSKFWVLLISAAMMTGCATVDFQSMGGDKADQVEASAVTENVVQRSVAQLETAFAARGMGVQSDHSSLEMAADILLNGMPEEGVKTYQTAYADQGHSSAIILSDIALAQTHVEKTARAALVYYETAPLGEDLSDELSGLEGALLTSERARAGFERALDTLENSDASSNLGGLGDAIDDLRRVTDNYGIRVRQARLQRLSETDVAS